MNKISVSLLTLIVYGMMQSEALAVPIPLPSWSFGPFTTIYQSDDDNTFREDEYKSPAKNDIVEVGMKARARDDFFGDEYVSALINFQTTFVLTAEMLDGANTIVLAADIEGTLDVGNDGNQTGDVFGSGYAELILDSSGFKLAEIGGARISKVNTGQGFVSLTGWDFDKNEWDFDTTDSDYASLITSPLFLRLTGENQSSSATGNDFGSVPALGLIGEKLIIKGQLVVGAGIESGVTDQSFADLGQSFRVGLSRDKAMFVDEPSSILLFGVGIISFLIYGYSTKFGAPDILTYRRT